MRAALLLAVYGYVAAHPHRDGPPSLRRPVREGVWQAPSAPSIAGPLNPQHRVLYVEGMFDNSYSQAEMLADATEVGASNFSTVVLAFMHVNGSGAPIYNNIPFSAATTLPECITRMRAGGVKTILISLGGAGTGSDFDHVASNFDSWLAATEALFSTLGIDGIDIDIESGMSSRMPVLQKIANAAAARNWTLTGAPCCSGPADWVTLVSSTKTSAGRCAFSWLHVQTYDDSGASGEFNLFNKALASVCPERPGFLLPGSDVADTRDAAAETKKIRAVAAGAPAGAVDGAFIWDYREIKLKYSTSSTAEYAAAIGAAFTA